MKIARTKEQLASNCNYIRGTQTTTVSALRTCPDTRMPSAQSNQSNKKSVEIVEHFTTKLEDHYTQHSKQSVRLVENTTEGLSLALTTGSNSLYIYNHRKDSRRKDKAFITICNTERPHSYRISALGNNSNIVEPLPTKWTTGIWPCTLPSEITPTTEQTTPAINET